MISQKIRWLTGVLLTKVYLLDSHTITPQTSASGLTTGEGHCLLIGKIRKSPHVAETDCIA